MLNIEIQFFGGRGGGGSGGARGGGRAGGGGTPDTKVNGVTVNLGGADSVVEAFTQGGLEIHASSMTEAVKNFNTAANSSGAGLKMTRQNANFYQAKTTWKGKVVPADTYTGIEVYQVRPGVYKFRQV